MHMLPHKLSDFALLVLLSQLSMQPPPLIPKYISMVPYFTKHGKAFSAVYKHIK